MNYMKIDMNYIGFLLMNDNDLDFLLLIFEIFVVLPLIIRVIYRRKYKLINNLKFFDNCIELLLNWYETLVFGIQTLILYVIIPKLYYVILLYVITMTCIYTTLCKNIMSYIHIV